MTPAYFDPFATTTACGLEWYGVEPSTDLARADVIEISLMSKSNDFGPGAYELSKGSTVHFRWLAAKPGLLAIANPTALSKPSPLDGLLFTK